MSEDKRRNTRGNANVVHFVGNTDVAVPMSRLADIVEISAAETSRLGLRATIKGHVGDSNFHENIFYDPSDPEQMTKTNQAVKNMVKKALEMEGTCTGEHGIGFGKKEALVSEVGSDTVMLMVWRPELQKY